MICMYLSLGSNLGRSRIILQEAVAALQHLPQTTVTAVSSLYQTPPWGKLDQPPFLNAAAEIKTALAAEELLRACQAVERAYGRVRHEKWGARTLDIDLVYSPEVTCSSKTLILPHPYVTERAFVLVPLKEIAPELVINGRTLDQWLERLPERHDIIKAEGEKLWKKY